MNRPRHKSVTLIELLIAVCIFALIVIGFSSIDTFSHYHVVSSDKRAKLQNDASYVLEHMSKEIGKAIGNEAVYGSNTVINTGTISGDTAIRVFIDLGPQNPDGSYQSGDGQGNSLTPTQNDRWIAYRFTDGGGNVSDQYQIWYYSSCVGPNCNQAGSSSLEVISRKISNFSSSYNSSNDYIEIQLTACWDADGNPVACGDLDNPALVMKNRIYMPAVSTH